jgi:hypothetical protein
MDWHMNLSGSGVDAPAEGEDAMGLLARFIDDLKARGHSIREAVFDSGGGEQSMLPAEEPAEAPPAEEPFGTESEPQAPDPEPVPAEEPPAEPAAEPVEEAGAVDSDDGAAAEVGADPGTLDGPPPAGS